MKDWNYFEIIVAYYRNYFRLIDKGVLSIEANNRVFDDFWLLPNEENKLINLVVIIQYINIEISISKRVNNKLANIFNEQLRMIDQGFINDFLMDKEKEHLEESIAELKMKL